MFAAENWCVKVGEKVYGPYTSEQMRKYAHEGRLASRSLISPAGSRAWREACEEAAFANFFGFKTPANGNLYGQKQFGKRDAAADAANDATKNGAAQAEPRMANFVIIFDVVSAAASRVEAAIMTLGNAFRIADNVWTVNCELTAVGVRNVIAPYLSTKESIFVVDTTHGRTSWQNYAPGLHSKISAAYMSTL